MQNGNQLIDQTAASPKIVVANWVHPQVLAHLRTHGTVVSNSTRDPWPRASLIEHCKDADALIAFMPERVDDEFLKACPQLRIIACALKGYDNFDIDACSRRGVWLTAVPDLLTAPTAELCVGMVIALGRNILPGHAFVKSGGFAGWRPRFYGRSLDGSVVGLVGAGALGQAIARRLSGFSCRVVYHDARALSLADETALDMHRMTVAELQAQSDFLVLAVPLTLETIGCADAAFIASMKPGSYLVNPARGSLVDEASVADALESGNLAGYAADAFACEDWARPDRPAAIDARLLASEKVVFTPHLGSAVEEARRQIEWEAARNVVQFLHGERPAGALNDIDPLLETRSC
jgi:phosphonate dehydrogenase